MTTGSENLPPRIIATRSFIRQPTKQAAATAANDTRKRFLVAHTTSQDEAAAMDADGNESVRRIANGCDLQDHKTICLFSGPPPLCGMTVAGSKTVKLIMENKVKARPRLLVLVEWRADQTMLPRQNEWRPTECAMVDGSSRRSFNQPIWRMSIKCRTDPAPLLGSSRRTTGVERERERQGRY